MNLVGMVERVREQWLAAAGLSLALLALVLGSLPGGSEPETGVLALRHSIAAGGVVVRPTSSSCGSARRTARPRC